MSRTLSRIGQLALVSSLLPGICFGCKAQTPSLSVTASRDGAPVEFRFPLPDGTSVSQQDLAGRYSILLFFTTYDTTSQVIARRLDELMHTQKPRINVLAVALEPPQNAPLVAVYRSTLNLDYDVALADQDTLEGQGPFGDVKAVPALVLLDRNSRLVYRGFGSEAFVAVRSQLEGASSEKR